ncbi:hypothetical protein [Methylobacterium sp. 10]|uniref:hypothetical protein n=1 Tax=Methylobacterium sp. 10 TaxID=1101191 RepID=UPI0009E021D1|nr:hypothetical protein [Methylobacterium sp. 10]
MAPSKLERFRDAHFPTDDGEALRRSLERGVLSGGIAPVRSEKPPRHGRRSVLGRAYFGLKLIVTLGPLAFLLLSAVAECGPHSSSLLPDVLKASACARRDLTRHVWSIENTLKTVSDRLR